MSEIPGYQGSKIPLFLLITYILLPILGIWALIHYWNGSTGFLDRDYWHKLQEAAGTTFSSKKE